MARIPLHLAECEVLTPGKWGEGEGSKGKSVTTTEWFYRGMWKLPARV